jgi:hypothetical protein
VSLETKATGQEKSGGASADILIDLGHVLGMGPKAEHSQLSCNVKSSFNKQTGHRVVGLGAVGW